MPTGFTSVDQIKDRFNLHQITNVVELRQELRRLLAEIHPDKSGGNFESIEKQELYFEISGAIDYLDGVLTSSNTLIPINDLKNLITLLRSEEKVNSPFETAEQEFSKSLNRSMLSIGPKFIVPKITVSAIAAAITAIWLFPSIVTTHPVLNKYVDVNANVFSLLWLYSLLFALTSWITLKGIEVSQKRFKSRLSLSSFQNKIFSDFIEYKSVQLLKRRIAEMMADGYGSMIVRLSQKVVLQKIDVKTASRYELERYSLYRDINKIKDKSPSLVLEELSKLQLKKILFLLMQGKPNFIESYKQTNHPIDDFQIVFSKDEFTNYLSDYFWREAGQGKARFNVKIERLLPFDYAGRVDDVDLALKLTELIIQRTISIGVVRKVHKNTFEEFFVHTELSYLDPAECLKEGFIKY